MRNIVGSKLPELSEAAEQEKGNGSSWLLSLCKTQFTPQNIQ